jgi:TonB family protein
VFDQAAAAAIARWRYQPQVVNGQAVDQRVAVRLRFSLDDR